LVVKGADMTSVADALIQRIESQGIGKGQILWIDVTYNNQDHEIIFVAFWSDRNITFSYRQVQPKIKCRKVDSASDEWTATMHEDVSQIVSKIAPANLISITGIPAYYDGGLNR
jgi:hypothetical protein